MKKRYLLNKATGDIKQYVKTKLLHRQQLVTFIFQGRNQIKGNYGNLSKILTLSNDMSVLQETPFCTKNNKQCAWYIL